MTGGPVSRLGLDDPAVRTAYLATKGVVILLAAGASWLLAPRLGARVWLAWGIFTGALVLVALAVVAAGRRRSPSPLTAGTGTGADTAQDGPHQPPQQPVVLPVEDALDLHPFAPGEIPSVVESYLEAAWKAGFREVRLIHGKGIGVQRERVRHLLSRHPLVLRHEDAPPERGGWGATIAWLRDEPEGAIPAQEPPPRRDG